jgi:hypothetical protein
MMAMIPAKTLPEVALGISGLLRPNRQAEVLVPQVLGDPSCLGCEAAKQVAVARLKHECMSGNGLDPRYSQKEYIGTAPPLIGSNQGEIFPSFSAPRTWMRLIRYR